MAKRSNVAGAILLALTTCPAALTSCGGGNNAGDARAACYPACVANVVKKCPLVTSCMVEIESYNPDISDPMQNDGVGTCYADGEKLWNTSNSVSDEIDYVETSDGGECYEVVEAPFVRNSLTYTMYVGGQTIATVDWEQSTNVTTITCADGTTAAVPNTSECNGWPWLGGSSGCDQGACSFGALPVAPVGD